jgi:hypothetical protein
MKTTATSTALFALLVLFVGCGPIQPLPDTLPTRGLTVMPRDQSVFLRASFDDDPSDFLGRFVPDGAAPADIDENRAAETRCSKYITFKEVRAAGHFDEVYNASTQAQASLGVTPFAAASGSHKAGSAVRVTYDLSKKLRAVKTDADAYDRCCRAAPDQCAGRFIGEFFMGSGSVFQAMGAADEAQAGGRYKLASADVEVKDQMAWRRVMSFEDVYFAFRVQAGEIEGKGGGECDPGCAWMNAVPSSLDGTYFVGLSAPAANRTGARDHAMRDARAQVVKYLGEYVASATQTHSSLLEGVLEDASIVNSVSAGLASRVKDRCWCAPEQQATPKGIRYVQAVLAFFPKEYEAQAAKEVLRAISEALRARGGANIEHARDLDQVIELIP